MKYIGISGQDNLVLTYLISNTIDLLKDNNNILLEEYKFIYKGWLEDIQKNPIKYGYSREYKYVYIDSIADNIKFFIEMLINCPHEYLYEEYDNYKDNILVNVKNFMFIKRDKLEEDNITITSPHKLYQAILGKNISLTEQDVYMTLQDFIIYFGLEVMQRFLGSDVWVKSIDQSKYSIISNGTTYKIYKDIKRKSEYEFIKKYNGIIIGGIKRSLGGASKINEINKDFYDYIINIDNIEEEYEKILYIVNSMIK